MATAKVSVAIFMCVVVMIKMTMADQQFGTIFVFGDSIVDVGTNNHLEDCKARADHPYYGIDYPNSIATGRFSNGLNSVDFLVRYISNNTLSPSPYLTLIDDPGTFFLSVLDGVNFASGGSGILNDTGRGKCGHVISLEEQIQQFATVCANIMRSFGADRGENYLRNSTYIISVGSNDFFDHQQDLVGSQITPEQLLTNLTVTFATHLENLYDLGARKFGIIGVPPIGCCPVERLLNLTYGGDGSCVVAMNDLAQSFHALTESVLQNFTSTHQGTIYSLGNSYRTIMDIIDNPRGSGFKEVRTACCGNGAFNAETDCELGLNLCAKRDDYLFWDWFHPTQAAANKAALTLAFGDGPEFVTPMNFSSLARANWIFS